MKVAWICHFSNDQVRKNLQVTKGRDFAPWITLLINEFQKDQEIELHVISPHIGLNKDILYEENRIYYYFLKTGIPYLKRNWPRIFKFDFLTHYHGYTRKIEKIIRKINPDIINLHGAENPYYSSSVLNLIDYPVLVNVQGIFSSIMAGKIKTKYDLQRAKIENMIYSNFQHFGVRADFMKDYIVALNPAARFYYQVYPIKSDFDIDIDSVKKEYDIVYFARLVKEKGIEDLLKAMRILTKTIPKITLCIIGSGDSNYINSLKKIISDSKLINHIHFKGLLKTQSEVHREAAKAKVSVLPTYNDTIPGTIIESMFMGLPVVSYPVGGIPSINSQEKIITFARIGDIKDLAGKIDCLLNNEKRALDISIKGKKTAKKMFDNKVLADQLIGYYKTILSNQKD